MEFGDYLLQRGKFSGAMFRMEEIDKQIY